MASCSIIRQWMKDKGLHGITEYPIRPTGHTSIHHKSVANEHGRSNRTHHRQQGSKLHRTGGRADVYSKRRPRHNEAVWAATYFL